MYTHLQNVKVTYINICCCFAVSIPLSIFVVVVVLLLLLHISCLIPFSLLLCQAYDRSLAVGGCGYEPRQIGDSLVKRLLKGRHLHVNVGLA